MTQHPYYKGVLAAFGYNTGQQHIQVFSHVRNLKNKALCKETKCQKDHEVLGALTLAWNIITTRAPKEAMDTLMRELEEVQIPLMITEDDKGQNLQIIVLGINMAFLNIFADPDVGYSFEIKGNTYTFSTAKRSPSEAYMSQNYTA